MFKNNIKSSYRSYLPGSIRITIIAVLFIFSCNKNNGPDIPQAYVNIYLRPNTIDYIPDGDWVYVTAEAPSRGIIIYRLLHDEFEAYERTCTYDPNGCCTTSTTTDCSRLMVEQSGLTIIDTCCGSQFLITDGSPFSGPAHYSLKQYYTEYDGEILHIFN
jgi:nitrite reductase/ring-hydroxylating ferredoxin subunit